MQPCFFPSGGPLVNKAYLTLTKALYILLRGCCQLSPSKPGNSAGFYVHVSDALKWESHMDA